MNQIAIRLSPKLFDLFQQCEVHCDAGCCGWDAFDWSDHWVGVWCSSRETKYVFATKQEIEKLQNEIAHLAVETPLVIQGFFKPLAKELTGQLDKSLPAIEQREFGSGPNSDS